MDAIDRLLSNLREQQQCMLADDMDRLAALVYAQEHLWGQLETELADGIASSNTQEKLVQLKFLVETNQLLAHQSLVFAGKVLRALADDAEYSDSGQPRIRPGKAIDFRA